VRGLAPAGADKSVDGGSARILRIIRSGTERGRFALPRESPHPGSSPGRLCPSPTRERGTPVWPPRLSHQGQQGVDLGEPTCSRLRRGERFALGGAHRADVGVLTGRDLRGAERRDADGADARDWVVSARRSRSW